jgi:hypothetical protein
LRRSATGRARAGHPRAKIAQVSHFAGTGQAPARKFSVLAQIGLSFDLSTASGKLICTIMAGLVAFERAVRAKQNPVKAFGYVRMLGAQILLIINLERAVQSAGAPPNGLVFCVSWARLLSAVE